MVPDCVGSGFCFFVISLKEGQNSGDELIMSLSLRRRTTPAAVNTFALFLVVLALFATQGCNRSRDDAHARQSPNG
jgi:hypothetical protein